MKSAILGVAALTIATVTGAQAQPASVERPPATPVIASKIILVGDSTTQVLSGWGGAFCSDHVTSAVACVNLARGGRSTYSYRAEGSWDLALAEMKTPGFARTFVIIQFGHNDQPGKPGRSTDLATEFPSNLERYVLETRAAGADPILFTPLTRRQFRDGRLVRDLDAWAAAIRKVAAEMKVPLVDLNARSADAVDRMGPSAANRFAQLPPSPEIAAAAKAGTTIVAASASPAIRAPVRQDNASVEPMGQAKLAFDYTHLGREGADYFARMVTQELAVAVPGMRPLLVP